MLSPFPTLLPFVLFAFVASITPGPTNILVLSNSARYGFRAALPIVFGACVSAALIVFLVGSGFGQTLSANPGVQQAMKWIGVIWLTYLAWQIFRTPAGPINAVTSERRLGLWGAAGLQWVNPKTWMMALAVVSVFANSASERTEQVVLLSLVFLLVSLPCLSAWAALGAGSSKLLRSSRALLRFNQFMALMLFASAWSCIWI